MRSSRRLESALAVLVKENKADVSAVAQQVDKIESIRAELNKTRTVMLYQINRLLTAEQRVKLEKLRARRDAERAKRNTDTSSIKHCSRFMDANDPNHLEAFREEDRMHSGPLRC